MLLWLPYVTGALHLGHCFCMSVKASMNARGQGTFRVEVMLVVRHAFLCAPKCCHYQLGPHAATG